VNSLPPLLTCRYDVSPSRFQRKKIQQIAVRLLALLQPDGQRPDISLGIVNRQPHFHTAEVEAVKSLSQVHHYACGQAHPTRGH
jgi:hypothetical protein